MAEVALELIGRWDADFARPDPHLVQQVVLPHDGNFEMRLDFPVTVTTWRLAWITPPPAGLEAENKRLRDTLAAIEEECRDRLGGDLATVSLLDDGLAAAILGRMGVADEETDWDAAGYDV